VLDGIKGQIAPQHTDKIPWQEAAAFEFLKLKNAIPSSASL
jgi:hypothetical protein